MKLTKKIFITGKIEVLTGLHIGGNSSTIEIGGVDNDIVKTGNGVPIIPGSSLKGKLRSLLAKTEGSTDIEHDSELIKKLFGGSVKDTFTTRLLVRDGLLDIDDFEKTFGDRKKRKLDFDYSEIKTENKINRVKGSAEHPRQTERVPAFAKFDIKMVLNVYENDNVEDFLRAIKNAVDLLNMDYLGGNGSRGYGEVNFKILDVTGKNISTTGISPIPEEDLKHYEQILITE